MKKQIILIAALLVACTGYTVSAQVNVQVNIGSQPVWGPVGYDRANYYYLPDIDAYYDVAAQQYVYLEGSQWVTRPSLPPQYANYDLYRGYKVVINSPRPWMHAERYRTQYMKYKGRHDQQVIRDSHVDKYRANPNHPEHNQYHGGQPNRGREEHDEHGDRGHEDHGHH
jgi:hypothetical protein